jgi:hypothetical protein
MDKTLFKFNIGEEVYIKGNWENVYTIVKIKGVKYQLKSVSDDGFVSLVWHHDKDLTNTRKSEFLRNMRLDKERKTQIINEQKTLIESILKEVFNYINWECKKRPCYELFVNDCDSPKLVFSWKEEDYQGSILVIYKYKYCYLYLESGFGSCSGCDSWLSATDYGDPLENIEAIQNCILREYNSLKVSFDTQFNLSDYLHPDCKQALNDWVSRL